MLKKLVSFAVSAVMLISAAGNVSAKKFSDVSEEAWYYGYADAVSEKGLMSGVSETEFAPDANVTRAMFVSVLYRLDGEPAFMNDLVFDDVPNDAYYTKAVVWAQGKGIVNGISDTEFAPDAEITREQLAAIIANYAKYRGIDTKKLVDLEEMQPPMDLEAVSDWAKFGVLYCFADGILKGDENYNFNPKNKAKRSEMAVILQNSAKLGDTLSATPQKVKNGAKAAIAFIHDDGGKATGNWLNTVLPKYNVNATVAIIGRSIDPECNVNEPDNFEKWQVILKNSNGRMNFAVHSHGHRYLGETDEAEEGVLSDGTEFSYEAGHMTKDIADERVRINGMFPDERLLAFVKPGTLYPEGKKQVSDAAIEMIKEHYIAMRNTGGEVDTLPPENIYSVKSLMGTSSSDYTNTEKNHTAQYWISEMDRAIEQNGLLVYLFHNIAESGASGNSTAQSRVELLLSAMQSRIDSGEIWNGKFDEIMQYTQEFNAITGVEAKNYPAEEKITVEVTDSISKIDTDLTKGKFAGLDMFDYPITVKLEMPYDWEYAELTQSYGNRKEIVKPFTENGVRYIYANVVPDQAAAEICEANLDGYITTVKINDAPIANFEPSKFYYKFVLPYGTAESPKITASSEDAQIEQVELSENGEGSAFVTLGDFRYEFYFTPEKAEKQALLRIDTSKDDENLTATKKIVEYLQAEGISANITDEKAYDTLKNLYPNVEYADSKDADNISFEFDDEITEKEGDFALYYNDFEKAFKENENDKLIMTVHPEDKGDLQLETFKDQIEYLKAKGVKLVNSKYFYGEPIYVLAIGNSFSDDSVRRLREIAAADGVDIRSYSAYVAGRPLASHYNAWNEDTTYRIDCEGASKYERLGTVHDFETLKNMVAKYDWDYVTLQGTTHYNSYDEGLWGVDSAETEKYWQSLADGVAELAPDAKRLVNATWSPVNELAANVNDGMFAGGTPDARGAYLAALLPNEQIGADIFSTEVRPDGKKAYIPVAVAVDYLVRYYGFPEYEDRNGDLNAPETRGVYRDNVCHLTNNVGRVLAGLVWYEMLTGTPATENKYQRSTLSASDMAKLKEAAHYACMNYMNYEPELIGSF